MTKSPTLKVRKRNGNVVNWDSKKIKRGIIRSSNDVGMDINGRFPDLISSILKTAKTKAKSHIIDTDNIRQIVKHSLMDYHYHDIAESFILFSNTQEKAHAEPDPSMLADYVTLTKYSRYLKTKKRREIYNEIVNRVEKMHLKKFPNITKEIKWSFNFVRDKKVLPSMRSMQYGGKAIEKNNAKNFNCSYSVCNRPRFFSEALWLLLSGTGVGFSVQFHHVDMIPELKFIDTKEVEHYIIPDTIEGWSNAVEKLINSYMITGKYIEFAYNKIRQQGMPLKTSGGRAPGHLPLKTAIENVRTILDAAQGRHLKPIECYDIMCMLADAVHDGSIREAAMICLFSLDDGEMMNAKTGNWHNSHPARARSNNSVVLVRDEVKKRQFERIFKATKQWGEPGFYFTDNEEIGVNPCCEISLNPKLTITPELLTDLKKWARKTGKNLPKLKSGQVYWGWQICNLTEINTSNIEDENDLYERAKAASIIGTIQAAYTDLEYLGWVSEAICNREALLGVSMTGIMDTPDIALDPEVQENAAQTVVETNISIASKIGIKSAARATCVKPSGSASIVLGAIGSGIHPHHADRYFRRIKAGPDCPVYQYFKEHNPHMCTAIDDRKAMVTFPVKAPNKAITRQDLSAVEFLKHIMSTQKHWVIPGTTKPNSTPGANHNVSNTVTVKDDEWNSVCNFLWKHREFFSGVSLLADIGDKQYANAPREAVVNESDKMRWSDLISNYTHIDWTKFKEETDNTKLHVQKACTGGQCEL